jgi:hypothetical protein
MFSAELIIFSMLGLSSIFSTTQAPLQRNATESNGFQVAEEECPHQGFSATLSLYFF